MRLRILLPCLALLAGLAGCADDDPARLKVRGSALVELDGTRSGFEFADDTLLEDDRVGRYDRQAGHCTIDRGETGEVDILSVGVSLPTDAPVMGEGVRSLTVRIEGIAGKVTAQMGDVEFVGDSGPGCTVIESYLDREGGVAGVEVSCELADADGRTAGATAELHFAGCQRL